MILRINTGEKGKIILAVKDPEGQAGIRQEALPASRSEEYLPLIKSFLKKNSISLEQIKKIEVASQGQGWTALRLGIVIANALAYALDIGIDVLKKGPGKLKKGRIQLIQPVYGQEPSITIKNKKIKAVD